MKNFTNFTINYTKICILIYEGKKYLFLLGYNILKIIPKTVFILF